MSLLDWLWAADLVAVGIGFAGYVYLSAVYWEELKQKRPAVRRHPGHYGAQPAEGGGR